MKHEAERSRLLEATRLAQDWHSEQTRKGSTIPYISHLLQVEGLVLEHGGDVNQAVAALLHDSLEDAPDADTRAEREAKIIDLFGNSVHAMVLTCTDTDFDEFLGKKRPWAERKERYLEQLRVAPAEHLLVVACDKQHNLRSLVWDLETYGSTYFNQFNSTPDQQIWYFRSALDCFRGRIPIRLEVKIEKLLEQLDDFVQTQVL